jgi:hypothetical protein
VVATIFSIIVIIHFFYATVGFLMFLNRQRVGYSFKDADQMRAFFDTILAMLFFVGLIISYSIGGNLLSSVVTSTAMNSFILNF